MTKLIEAETERNDPGYMDRRPFLYLPKRDSLVVGRPGTHHQDLLDHQSIPWDSSEPVGYGAINLNNGVHSHWAGERWPERANIKLDHFIQENHPELWGGYMPEDFKDEPLSEQKFAYEDGDSAQHGDPMVAPSGAGVRSPTPLCVHCGLPVGRSEADTCERCLGAQGPFGRGTQTDSIQVGNDTAYLASAPGAERYPLPNGAAPWQPGVAGRALVGPQGQFHAWTPDYDYIDQHPEEFEDLDLDEWHHGDMAGWLRRKGHHWADHISGLPENDTAGVYIDEDGHTTGTFNDAQKAALEGNGIEVRPDQWAFAKTADFGTAAPWSHIDEVPFTHGDDHSYHTWQPGQIGKGFILPDGRPVTWNIEQRANAPAYSGPHHAEVAEHMGLPRYPDQSDESLEGDIAAMRANGFDTEEDEVIDPSWHSPIYIDENGNYDSVERLWNSSNWKIDPGDTFDKLGLKKNEQQGWKFASETPKVIHNEEHPYQLGGYGKAAYVPHRDELHIWGTNWSDDGYPIHQDYLSDRDLIQDAPEGMWSQSAYYPYVINPQGEVTDLRGGAFPHGDHRQLIADEINGTVSNRGNYFAKTAANQWLSPDHTDHYFTWENGQEIGPIPHPGPYTGKGKAKGYVRGDKLYLWPLNENEQPHHDDMINHDDTYPDALVYIDPDGTYEFANTAPETDKDHIRGVLNAHGFTPGDARFAAEQMRAPEGTYHPEHGGKGVVLHDGSMHFWPVSEGRFGWGDPHHDEWLEENGYDVDDEPAEYMYVKPDGTVERDLGGHIGPKFAGFKKFIEYKGERYFKPNEPHMGIAREHGIDPMDVEAYGYVHDDGTVERHSIGPGNDDIFSDLKFASEKPSEIRGLQGSWATMPFIDLNGVRYHPADNHSDQEGYDRPHFHAEVAEHHELNNDDLYGASFGRYRDDGSSYYVATPRGDDMDNTGSRMDFEEDIWDDIYPERFAGWKFASSWLFPGTETYEKWISDPVNNWNGFKTAPIEPYDGSTNAKGFIQDGKLTLWAIDHNAQPHHHDILGEAGHPDAYVYVDKLHDGNHRTVIQAINGTTPQYSDIMESHGLNRDHQEMKGPNKFANAETPSGEFRSEYTEQPIQPFKPYTGGEGKAVVTRDGRFIAWATNDYGEPHHYDVDRDARSYYQLHPVNEYQWDGGEDIGLEEYGFKPRDRSKFASPHPLSQTRIEPRSGSEWEFVVDSGETPLPPSIIPSPTPSAPSGAYVSELMSAVGVHNQTLSHSDVHTGTAPLSNKIEREKGLDEWTKGDYHIPALAHSSTHVNEWDMDGLADSTHTVKAEGLAHSTAHVKDTVRPLRDSLLLGLHDKPSTYRKVKIGDVYHNSGMWGDDPWEPGWEGKGLVDSTGKVHSWINDNVRGHSGLHHEEYAATRGLDYDPMHTFFIDEDGGVSGLGRDLDFEYVKDALGGHPFLKTEGDEWKFANRGPATSEDNGWSFSASAGKMPGGPFNNKMNVVHVKTDVNEHGTGHAIIYDKENDVAYVGSPGSSHYDLSSPNPHIPGNREHNWRLGPDGLLDFYDWEHNKYDNEFMQRAVESLGASGIHPSSVRGHNYNWYFAADDWNVIYYDTPVDITHGTEDHPFIADIPTKTVHVGPIDSYHHDIPVDEIHTRNYQGEGKDQNIYGRIAPSGKGRAFAWGRSVECNQIINAVAKHMGFGEGQDVSGPNKFARTATTVTQAPEDDSRDKKQPTLKGRIPYVYNPETDIVHVGRSGWHHRGLMPELGRGGQDWQDLHLGYAYPEAPSKGHYWYGGVANGVPENHIEIEKALNDHIGADIAHFEPDDDWGKFASVQLHDSDHNPSWDIRDPEKWQSLAMIYEPETNTTHVGMHDDVYHDEILDNISQSRFYDPDHYKGALFREDGGIKYQWYDKPELEEEEAAVEHLQNHFGQPVSPIFGGNKFAGFYDGPPEFRQYDTNSMGTKDESSPWWSGRIPLIYDHDNHIIHYGNPDSTHHDVYRETDMDLGSPYSEGWIGWSPERYRGNEESHENFGWYSHEPPPGHVQQAVLDHFGVGDWDLDKAKDFSDWKFAKIAWTDREKEFDKWKGTIQGDRIPVVHWSDNNKTIIGQRGQFHDDLFNSDKGYPYTGEYYPDERMFRWQGHIEAGGNEPPAHKEVMNKLKQQFGPNIRYEPTKKEDWFFAKTASKIEWLQERPDKFKDTPKGQDALNGLVTLTLSSDKIDPLTPWLWREAKKNRIKISPQGNIVNLEEPFGSFGRPNVSHWADWFASNSPTRRGVDLMGMRFNDFTKKIKDWDEELAAKNQEANMSNGKVLYQLPNGWTVRELAPEDLSYEGDNMGHCVGGYGYEDAVRNGDTRIISLRDEQNLPHATMELKEKAYHSVVCGECRRPLGVGEHTCPRCGYHNEFTSSQDPWEIEQVQGKGNEQPKPEYQAMLKQWVQSLPENQRPVWKQADENISDLNEIVGDDQEQDPHGWGGYEPHGDYGVPLPPKETDYDSVIQDLHRMNDSWRGYGRYDPEHGEKLYEHALGRNEIPELAKAHEGYMEEAQSELTDAEDMNWEYLGYPGDYDDDPEKWEEIGKEEGLTGKQAYDEAYEQYSDAQSELAETVPMYQASRHMGDLLSQHWSPQTGQFENPTPKPSTFA